MVPASDVFHQSSILLLQVGSAPSQPKQRIKIKANMGLMDKIKGK
jgi:hypothetical protein